MRSASVSRLVTLTAACLLLGSNAQASELSDWLQARLPEGGKVGGDGASLNHTVAPKETYESIAQKYLNLTREYSVPRLAAKIKKQSPRLKSGETIAIPDVVTRALKSPKEERLGMPADRILKGVFVTGAYAQIRWIDILDASAARGFNAVVVDVKDYMGGINFNTKAALAAEGKTAKAIFLPDLARTARMAHDRGIRVIARIPCFHDPMLAKNLPRTSIQGTWGKPYPMGWTDPTNVEVQNYILDIVKETIEAGFDEVQLDYIRFPVHAGTASAVMPDWQNNGRINAIRDFVHRVHEVTKPAGVWLSVDVFGVTATGTKEDQQKLGQDITVLAPEVEAISPMVYPSHYAAGFMGFDEPGDHPEVIAMGTKNAVSKLPAGSQTAIRGWLQAFPLRSPSYGPKYVAAQAKHAENNGGLGWLMWSPACEYSAVWSAWPVIKK